VPCNYPNQAREQQQLVSSSNNNKKHSHGACAPRITRVTIAGQAAN
jgi:hypothetical protein